MAIVLPLKYKKSGAAAVALQELEAGDQFSAGFISGLMGKNRLINGDLSIWQRGISFAASQLHFSADRWLVQCGGSTIASSRLAIPGSQTLIPGNPRNAIRCVVNSVANTANYASLRQRIEGVDTLAGQRVTLSFWAKADGNKSISVEFCQRVGSAEDVLGIGVTKLNLTSTWTKQTISFDMPVFAASTFGTDYLEMFIWMDAGSQYNARTASLGQQSGTFDFTMLQLEAGALATDFEFRHPAAELLMCQRYYEKSYSIGVYPGAADRAGSYRCSVVNGFFLSAGTIPFAVVKRAAPSITIYAARDGSAGNGSEVNNSGVFVANRVINPSQAGTSQFQTGGNNTMTAGSTIEFHWTADSEF